MKGERREDDARRTYGRSVIVDATVHCMVERGYHGTSIRDIARRAGLTSAALYHHFGSKQEILREIMEIALRDALAMTQTALEEAGSAPRDRLASLVRAWVLFHTTRQDEALIGATELRSLEPANRKEVVRRRDEQEDLFREVINDGVETGDFSVPDLETAARAILTMGTSIATWYDPSGSTTPNELADQFADLALGLVGAASEDTRSRPTTSR